jgi:hypothetical protein
MFTWHFKPGGMEPPQLLLLMMKSGLLEVLLVIFTVEVPLLVRKIGEVGEVIPIGCPPKVSTV